jgi:O-antigen/teichoic acid export membrane protein
MSWRRWLLSRGGPLKERAVRGGIWLLIGDGLARVAGLAKIAVLGRLLAPGDFGLMGIAMALLRALEYTSETGFNAALIHRAGDIRPYLDTVWSAQILRSAGVAALLVAGAPAGAWFFDNPAATPVIQAIALVTLLRGFLNPAVIYLRKDLEFQRLVVWRSSGVLVGVVVGIGVALVEPTVWALVASVVAAQAGETLASYWAVPYRPRLRWDRARAGEMFRFGKWIFGANLLAFLGLYADAVAVGRLLGTTALGFYQMAQTLATLPTSAIGQHVRGVTFPALAKVQEIDAQRRGLLLSLGLVGAVVVPVGCAVTVFAEAAIELIVGARWLEMAPTLRWLVWAGAATALSGVTNGLFQARGRPDLVVKLGLVQIGLWAVAFHPLTTAHGIAGMAIAVTGSAAVGVVVKIAVAGRLVGASPLALLGTSRVALIGAAPFVVAGAFVPAGLSFLALLGAAIAGAGCAAILGVALRFHFRMWPFGDGVRARVPDAA